MTRRGYTNGIFAISIAMMIYYTDAVKTITLDSYSCNDKVYDLDHGDSIEIKWEGLSLPSYCRLGVEAPDTSSSTCINIEKFRIYGCVFQIQLYKEDSEFPTHTYDCSSADIDDEYCIEEQRITLLKFTYNSTGSISFRPNVRLTVKVDAMEATATEEVTLVGNILGGLVGFVFLSCVVCIILQVCKRCYQELGMPCREACEALSNASSGACEALSTAVSGCLSRLCDMLDFSSTRRTVRNARDTGPSINRQDTENTLATAGTSTYVTVEFDNSTELDRTVSLESLASLELPDTASPSAPPAENGWEPPSYSSCDAQLPPSQGAQQPDVPPPSYYDVVTQNKYKDV